MQKKATHHSLNTRSKYYSGAAAGRRIAAMRLLVDVPEIEPALKDGSVNLSTLSTIQSFIQRKDEPVSKSEKRELVFALQGKSRRECEKHLVALDPSAATPKEKERVISPTQTEIRFVADDALMEKIQKIRELDGHVQSNPSYLELFHRMADLALKKLDSLATKSDQNSRVFQLSKATSQESDLRVTPPAEPDKNTNSKKLESQATRAEINPRFISAALKREIWQRDQGRCQFKSSDGKKCGSRFALEIDHITPFSWNGKTEPGNLQLLCRTHNRLKAFRQLGPDVMNRYPSIRRS